MKWDVWMENLLVAAIGRFPESTLTMLKFRLDAACAARNLPTVSVSTIGRRLDKKLITWKVPLSSRARYEGERVQLTVPTTPGKRVTVVFALSVVLGHMASWAPRRPDCDGQLAKGA